MIGALRTIRRAAVRASGPMTALGRGLLGLGIAAWVAGAWLDWQELMVVAAACAVALLIGAAFTFGRTELDVALRLHPQRVVAGNPAVAELEVRNVATRRMLPVRLELPVGRALAGIDVPSLTAGEAHEETIVVPTSRRSVIAIGPVRSVRGDPLGVMRREVSWAAQQELFVHPRTTRLAGLWSGWMRDLEGRPTNDRSPNDVAFHTLREYVPGDDRRHVHWRTSARLGKLMVRQFIDNRRSHLGLVVDTDPADYEDADEFELAVSMAASLGVRALVDGQEVSCVAGEAGVNAHTGQSFLDGLARVELGAPAITIDESARRSVGPMSSTSVIAVFTGAAASVPDVQRAARRFGPDVSLLCVRAAPHDAIGVMAAARLTVITADSLQGFDRVMRKVGKS